jgi:hypothetical protein
MQTDQVKLIAATVVAMVLAIGGPILLVWVFMQPDMADKAGLTALLGGFATFGIQFLFGQEQRTGAVRSFERGLNTPVPDPNA